MSDDAAAAAAPETKPEGGSEPITVRVRDQVSATYCSYCNFTVVTLRRVKIVRS